MSRCIGIIYLDSSDSVVLQALQTKPSLLFWSSQVRKEAKYKCSAGDLSYYTVYATKFEIVRQKLRETLCKMFSCDNNIKRAVHLVIIARLLYTIPTVFHHLNPTDTSSTSYLATWKPSLKFSETFSNYKFSTSSSPVIFPTRIG